MKNKALLPEGWPRPKGYANGVAASGRQVYVAGQVGWTPEGRVRERRLRGAGALALANVVAVLRAGGARPEHIVRMTWYVTSKREYLAAGREIGTRVSRDHRRLRHRHDRGRGDGADGRSRQGRDRGHRRRPRLTAARTQGEHHMAKAKASFHWDDPLLLDQQLTDDERAGARGGARLRAGPAPAARARGVSQRHDRRRDLSRDGRARPARLDHPRAVRRRRHELRLLRPGRARGRARRLGLPLDDERAVVARHGADQRVRHRGAEAEVPAQAGERRMDRLLRPDRAEPRLRPRQHGHAREEGRRRLLAQRQQDVDHQLADRRRVRGLGQGRRRRDPRLRPRQGRQGT